MPLADSTPDSAPKPPLIKKYGNLDTFALETHTPRARQL